MAISTRPPRAEAVAAAADELAVYDSLRAGRRDAFVALAADLDPVLRDLAAAVTPAGAPVDWLVRHTWEVALAGLDLFAWRCSLRAWVAGVLVGWAGGAAPPEVAPPGAARPALGTRASGPPDWADLPWGARWSEAAWDVLAQARDGLTPLAQQVLVLRDGHGWDDRDACDALGLTEARYRQTLAGARLALHDALAVLAGGSGPACGHDRAGPALAGPGMVFDCPPCATLAVRLVHVTALVAGTASAAPAAPDPALLALFRRWRAARRGGLRQRLMLLRRGQGAARPVAGRAAHRHAGGRLG